MARRRRYFALVCAVALAYASGRTAAAALARLTVTAFTLSSDVAQPQVEKPFHIVVTARVRERIARLDTITLPILAELELLGDERRWSADANGTTYREVITVIAHHTGSIHLAPATLDCIDARDGAAKRYSSNALDLWVGGNPMQPMVNAESAVTVIGRFILGLVAVLVGVVCAVLIVVLLFRRRTRTAPAVPLPPPPPVPVRTADDDLRDACTILSAERSRSAAMRVRTLARRLVGANERETLTDVLRRPQASELRLSEVLGALERAAFTHDADLSDAIDAAIAALEQPR